MSMRRPDPQLQRAWRSKPPRSQRAVQGALALVAALAVGVAGALLVRSCNGDDEVAPAVLPPLTSATTTTTTTTTTTVPMVLRYEVQSGDSLFSIAQRFGVTMAALAELNGIDNPDRIEAGQVLLLPPNATTTVPSSSTSTPGGVADATVSADAPTATTSAP
jgi:LysM repeat protein